MTIGRAMDADGNIHLEGNGVVPDLRVPVTAETLLQQYNGEDVILAFAERAISQPLGAGITPSGPPEVASAATASSAFSSGKRFVEDLAREQYESADFGVPGTLTYTIPIQKEETLVWMYAWCTSTQEVLTQNFENIEVKFTLNGEDLALDSLKQEELENGGQWCRLYYTALSKWPAGEHKLSIATTFTTPINDGSADYEAGNYVLEYNVFVKP